jgi:dihydrofolate reductase
LNEVQNVNKLEYGYDSFIDSIDTILLGKNTYIEILKSHKEWPYKDCTTYVMSRDPDLEIKTPDTYGLNGLSPETVEKLHAKSQKNIWIL